MTESMADVPVAPDATSPRTAPRRATWLLVIAPFLVLLAALVGVAVSVLVVPLFDPSPLVAWLIVRRLRRWDGVAHRLLSAVERLAGVMMLEWVVVYASLIVALRLASGSLPQRVLEVLGLLWSFYQLEVLMLLTLFLVASAVSHISLGRCRRAAVAGAATDDAAAGDG